MTVPNVAQSRFEFLLCVVIEKLPIYIKCESFNYLSETVHEMQASDKWMGRQPSVIRPTFLP